MKFSSSLLKPTSHFKSTTRGHQRSTVQSCCPKQCLKTSFLCFCCPYFLPYCLSLSLRCPVLFPHGPFLFAVAVSAPLLCPCLLLLILQDPSMPLAGWSRAAKQQRPLRAETHTGDPLLWQPQDHAAEYH